MNTTQEHEIRCPHCDGLFISTPLSVLWEGYAECQSDDDLNGNCNKVFWIQVGKDTYVTLKTMPTQENDPDGQ